MPGPAIHLLLIEDLQAQLRAAGGSTAARRLRARAQPPAYAPQGAHGAARV